MPTLSVRCPACQQVLKLDAALAGQATACTHCGQRMMVPSPGAPPIAAPPPNVAPAAPPTLVTPTIQVAPKSKPAPLPAAPQRELSPRVKEKRGAWVQLVLLVLGVLILAAATALLLYLTDGGQVH
jgi:hypothetical protein